MTVLKGLIIKCTNVLHSGLGRTQSKTALVFAGSLESGQALAHGSRVRGARSQLEKVLVGGNSTLRVAFTFQGFTEIGVGGGVFRAEPAGPRPPGAPPLREA